MSTAPSTPTTEAEIHLKHGAKFPYDAGEEWWDGDGETPPPPAMDWAHAAARGILADLNDRRGIKHALHDVDHDVRQELTADLAEIIRAADQAELTGDHLTDPAPQLSDEAWSFLVEHGKVHTGGSFVRFDGDWGNWNWLWSEIWKRCQR